MEEEFYRNLGIALKEERKRRNIKQPEIAEKLGVTVAMISYWESGSRQMNAKELKLFCKALGVPVQSIIDQT